MIYKYRSASVALVFPAQLTTVNSAKRILGTCNGSIGSMQVLKEQVLDNIYHDQSDVVLLRVRGRLPSANFAEQFVCKLRRCAHLAAKNNLFELSDTEWFAFGIFGLNHAIGLEEKAITGADGNIAHGILRLRRHSKNQTVAFDTLQCSGA